MLDEAHGKVKSDIDSDSSSDAALPPPLPVKKTSFVPGLKIGGLGLSTVAQGNGKTAEEMADE